MSPEEFRQQYPFCMEGRVEWADMDAFEHVNNTVYFRYFERVRIEYFLQKGLLGLVESDQIGPILASTQCRFRLPLNFPDDLLIGTRISDLQSDRFLMQYAVYSQGHKKLAADGDGLIVCYDYAKGQKTAIPAAIQARLKQT